jgi:CDP-glucose 4,6-dehydratase
MIDFWKNKKVLITGNNGFKGSWLSLILYMFGAQIYGYSLNEKKNKINENIFKLKKISKKNIYGDVRDKKKLYNFFKFVKPDICIHLAAQSLVLDSLKESNATLTSNILGTINVLEILKTMKITALIVTSDKCYLNNYKILNEDSPLGGDDPYSASKACCEILVNSYIKSFNLRIASVRSGNVIGGGDWNANRLVPDIMNSIFKKKILKIRNANHARPWQHVLDVNFSYISLLQKLYKNKKYSSAYNVAPNKSYKVKKIILYFKKYLGRIVYKEKNHNFEKKTIFLNSKKIKKIGINNKLNLKKILDLTYNWYKMFFLQKKKVFNYSQDQINMYLKNNVKQ